LKNFEYQFKVIFFKRIFMKTKSGGGLRPRYAGMAEPIRFLGLMTLASLVGLFPAHSVRTMAPKEKSVSNGGQNGHKKINQPGMNPVKEVRPTPRDSLSLTQVQKIQPAYQPNQPQIMGQTASTTGQSWTSIQPQAQADQLQMIQPQKSNPQTQMQAIQAQAQMFEKRSNQRKSLRLQNAQLQMNQPRTNVRPPAQMIQPQKAKAQTQTAQPSRASHQIESEHYKKFKQVVGNALEGQPISMPPLPPKMKNNTQSQKNNPQKLQKQCFGTADAFWAEEEAKAPSLNHVLNLEEQKHVLNWIECTDNALSVYNFILKHIYPLLSHGSFKKKLDTSVSSFFAGTDDQQNSVIKKLAVHFQEEALKNMDYNRTALKKKGASENTQLMPKEDVEKKLIKKVWLIVLLAHLENSEGSQEGKSLNKQWLIGLINSGKINWIQITTQQEFWEDVFANFHNKTSFIFKVLAIQLDQWAPSKDAKSHLGQDDLIQKLSTMSAAEEMEAKEKFIKVLQAVYDELNKFEEELNKLWSYDEEFPPRTYQPETQYVDTIVESRNKLIIYKNDLSSGIKKAASFCFGQKIKKPKALPRR
jgi:hypothetical protein